MPGPRTVEADTPPPSSRADTSVRSVSRAVELLTLFDEAHPSRSLREIVAATGLPKTTVVRLLSTLDALALTTGSAELGYTLGPAFLRWVSLAGSLWDVGAEVRAVMQSLVDSFGETVNIYVRQDLSRIAIAQCEGTSTVRSVVGVGVPYPLARGAAAKILLGGASPSVVQAVAADLGRPDAEALRSEIAEIAHAGYAVTHGEREFGASAVAAPILGEHARPIAALSMSGPTSRYTPDRVAAYVDAAIRTARAISDIGLGTAEAFL